MVRVSLQDLQACGVQPNRQVQGSSQMLGMGGDARKWELHNILLESLLW